MRAVLDSNLFFSMWTLDPLLSFAEADFYQPVWSNVIMAEVTEHLSEVWSHATKEKVSAFLQAINSAFPEALISLAANQIFPISLPDPDDEHVLTAAIQSHSNFIVTNNLKHFPQEKLATQHVAAISPDNFLCHLFESSPEESSIIIQELVSEKNHPPRSIKDEITHLQRVELTQFSRLLEQNLLH